MNPQRKGREPVLPEAGSFQSNSSGFGRCRLSPASCFAVWLTEAEAGAVIEAWPTCPTFASRRVDALTVRTDRLLGREVAL